MSNGDQKQSGEISGQVVRGQGSRLYIYPWVLTRALEGEGRFCPPPALAATQCSVTAHSTLSDIRSQLHQLSLGQPTAGGGSVLTLRPGKVLTLSDRGHWRIQGATRSCPQSPGTMYFCKYAFIMYFGPQKLPKSFYFFESEFGSI